MCACILLNIPYGDGVFTTAVVFMTGIVIADVIFDDIDRYTIMIELLIEDNRGNVISHQLGEGRHTLGKSPESDIILMDSYASRYHADIVVAKQAVFIVDADSKNGIRYKKNINRKTLKLKNGDSFYIGSLTLTIRQPKFQLYIKNGRKFDDDRVCVDLSEISSSNIEEAVSRLLHC